MELRAVEIAPLHAGAERHAVLAARDRGGAERQRVAVHEVGVVAVLQALEQGAGTVDLERVPSHVRHRPARRTASARRGPE